MPTTVKIRRSGTASATPSALEHGEIAINYADGKVFWKNASDVITSFTFQSYALASHTHSISDVTGLQTALDGKASSSHTHSISDVTGLQTALDGKAASSHTHSISDVTGLQTALDGKASSSHTHAASDITSGTLDIARIANDAVTYAKLQNVSATDRLLGRSSAGAGDVEEITCTSFGRSLIDDADAEAARTTLSVQPTAGPSFTAGITVTQAMASPTVVLRNTAADATDKAAQVVGAHYTATEETVQGIGIYSTATENLVAIGGGSALSNAASEVRLYTAANTTTTTGTIRLTISSTGTATFAGQIVGQAGAAITGTLSCGDTVNIGTASTTSTIVNVGAGATGNRFALIDCIGDTTYTDYGLRVGRDNGGANGQSIIHHRGTGSLALVALDAGSVQLGTSSETRLTISSTGTATFAGQVLVTAGSGSSGSYKPGVAISGDDDTGVQQVGGANTLSVVTGGTERVRVDASGNVGIGTTSPAYALDVRGGSAALINSSADPFFIIGEGLGASDYGYIQWDRTNNHLAIGSGSTSVIKFVASNSATEWMRLNAGGALLIGTTADNGAYLLQVNSQIYATNATIATSDARFKTNVESLTDATSVIESLRPVAFDFIPQEDRNFATERQVGLIAQEAEAALAGTDYADSVVAQCGDHLGLAYEKLVPVLIRALQESNARIAALEERING